MTIVRPGMVGAVDGDGAADGDDHEFFEDARAPVRVMDPKKPKHDEVEEHKLTHLPFRSWCRHCVHGRGVEAAHRKLDREESQVNEVHCDFMFLGPRDEPGETIPCFVMREVSTRMTLSAPVPSKSTGTFVASRTMAFLEEIGCKHMDLVVKSDQEPAIQAIVDEVGRRRAAIGAGRFVVEHSPVGASASNGVAERAIQSVQGQVRVLKLALEDRLQVKIPHRHPVVPWIMEYAGFLLNRFEVGRDGKTAYERLKGRRSRTLGLEIGEAIHWRMKPARGALGKLDSVWADGVYLGIRGKSGEVIVGDPKGVWKTRTIRRKPFDERWSSKNLDSVIGVPWRLSDTDEKSDGEKYRADRLEPQSAEPERAPNLETMPRSVNITKKDLEAFGYTAKCPGCLSVVRGTARQAHSSECRNRIEKALRGTERYKRATARFDEHTARVLEQEEEQRASKRRKGDEVELDKVVAGGRSQEWRKQKEGEYVETDAGGRRRGGRRRCGRWQ